MTFHNSESFAEQVGLMESLGLFGFDTAIEISSSVYHSREVPYL